MMNPVRIIRTIRKLNLKMKSADIASGVPTCQQKGGDKIRHDNILNAALVSKMVNSVNNVTV